MTTLPTTQPAAGAPARRYWPARLGASGVWTVLAAATAYVLAFNPTDRVADPTGPS